MKLPKYLTCCFYRAKTEEDKQRQAEEFISGVKRLTGSNQNYRMSIQGGKAVFREAVEDI